MNYLRNAEELVNNVYLTSDLTKFKQITGNRPHNPQHVKRLTSSIKRYGVLQNPIIVNENMVVVDGQHRLLAAIEAASEIYYIIVPNYGLDEVQVLNLNQKNWTRRDFLHGYAQMGIPSYVKLVEFMKENNDFAISTCIALCSNASGRSIADASRTSYNEENPTTKKVFEEGTWVGKDFKLAQENADKLKMIKNFYSGYNRGTFASAMLGLFKNNEFNFFDFLNKLKIQPNRLEDCTSVSQYKLLIEDIYNYKRRGKVNLRY